jgi:hypothetical protein
VHVVQPQRHLHEPVMTEEADDGLGVARHAHQSREFEVYSPVQHLTLREELARGRLNPVKYQTREADV